MDNSTVVEAVKAAAETGPDGRRKLACARAFEISGKLGVPVSLVGEICNRENIRIQQCQLGCFK